MFYIFIGSTAFVFFFMFDYYNLRNQIAKKYVCSLLGVVIFVFSVTMTFFTSQQVDVPVPLKIFSGGLSLIFCLLLIYSLFLELPFKQTYTNSTYNSKLVDTGTYALTRHPGVLWFFLFFMFLFLATGLVLVALGGIGWTIVNVIYVYFQEKVFFIKMFPEYRGYQKTTPMLIPNYYSIRRCIKTTFKGGKTHDKFERNVKTR